MEEKQLNGRKFPGGKGHRESCPCRICSRVRNAIEQGKPARRTLRQRFAENIAAQVVSGHGVSLKDAAVAAGYSQESAGDIGSQLIRQDSVQKSISVALERAGITEGYWAGKVREGLEAEAVWRVLDRDKGEVIERRDPDHFARHKFLETVGRVRGYFPKDEPTVQAALILRLPDRQLDEEEWNAHVGAPAKHPKEFSGPSGGEPEK